MAGPARLPRQFRLSLASDLQAGLAEVRKEPVCDAVRNGWLRRLHHHEPTKAGEELASQVRAFRQELRSARAGRGPEILDGAAAALRAAFRPGQPRASAGAVRTRMGRRVRGASGMARPGPVAHQQRA